jgi:hypothetical protein
MKAMNIFEEKTKFEKFLLSYEKSKPLPFFLNKKRFKLSSDPEETTRKLKEDKIFFHFPFSNKNMTEFFLETYSQIMNEAKFKNNKYYFNEKKEYFDTTFNLKLVKTSINYFLKVKSSFRNANLFNSKDLNHLIKTFLINETQFSILTLLLDEFIVNFPFSLKKENIYYLGLYTKYISSDFYAEVFQKMLITNIFFKLWYLQYKQFLEKINVNAKKISKQNNSFMNNIHKIDSIDFNSMIENLIDPIKEKKEIKKFNIIKSNIGKKLNVVVVYQEDSSQDNTNYFEEKDSFNNEKEQDPNNIIVQL